MIDRMDQSLPTVRLAMWTVDAIVLFAWLMSADLNAVPVRQPAEKQALADLLTRLEHEMRIVVSGRSWRPPCTGCQAEAMGQVVNSPTAGCLGVSVG